LDNALVADIQNTENSGQSGVVHDDSGEEDIVESSLF